jgi:diguanylate cyclase (GGDEF)-like protein/PAS domain S-box-containing protein
VTPSLEQRLGFAPVDLPAPADRRALLAARSASALFAVQSVLAVAAASIGATLGPAVVATALVTLSFAVIVLCAYERLPWAANQLLAAGGTATIAFLVGTQPQGQRYAFLFVALVIYVAFFFRGRHAVGQLALVCLLGGSALLVALPPRGALETWALLVGALVQAAGTTIALRRYLMRALERTRTHRAVLDAFFQNAPAGFAFMDAELRFRRVNSTLAELLGRPAEEIVGRTIRELAPERADAVEALLHRVLDEGVPVSGIETSYGDRNFLSTYYPVAASDGAAGVGVSVIDVSELKHAERRLEESNRRLTVLATTDELTGLPNRRMLTEQLELAIARARRGGLAVAILCIDLDRFKDVNDSLGHAMGDDLLVEVAARLRTGARATDVVARYGGDEFVILLADLDVKEAPELAATVVERVGGLLRDPLAVGPVELRAAASIGVAMFPHDSGDAKGLLAAADAAMYAGKSALTRVA